jgi:hypothetical protein
MLTSGPVAPHNSCLELSTAARDDHLVAHDRSRAREKILVLPKLTFGDEFAALQEDSFYPILHGLLRLASGEVNHIRG